MNFTFNGVNSSFYGLKVKESNHLSNPAKRIESIEVDGRTGNLIIDDGSFRNQTIELSCFLDCRDNKNLALKSRQIGQWLQSPIGYKLLAFDDGLKFNAVCINQIDIKEMIDNFGEVLIRFDATEVA